MENKTSKYLKYAIGEIVLVVIGILLALQISEWNSTYKRHKVEHLLLQDIHEEFLQNKKQLGLVINKHRAAYQATSTLTRLLPYDIVKIEKDSIVSLLDSTYHNWTFNPNQATINSLINTSSFDLISNPELRRLLQKWTDQYLDYTEEEVVARSLVRNYYAPYMSKHLDIKYVINKRPLEDINWDFLTSIEFHNVIAFRHKDLKDILESQHNELNYLIETIDRIIELTRY